MAIHSSLQQFPVAYDMLQQAVLVEVDDLTGFLGNYQFPDTIDMDDRILITTMQLALNAFVQQCRRIPAFAVPSRRSFWYDHVVPVFEAFGDISQLVQSDWWYASVNEQHVEFTVDQASWEKVFDDDYNNFGNYNDNKMIHAMIISLNSYVRRHLGASFTTLCGIKSFGLRCTGTILTLSITTLHPHDIGQYNYHQVKTADIPLDDDTRGFWLSMFDLVAYLLLALREQQKMAEAVENEHAGDIQVKAEDRASAVLGWIPLTPPTPPGIP